MKIARRMTRWLLLALALLICAPTLAAAGCRSAVLPADARPYGYSLRDMTKALASFSSSGNKKQYYPDTPFQILYADFENSPPPACDDDGCFSTGGNSFTVKRGQYFFVPIWNATDSPPVAGTYPQNRREAKHYFFDRDQVGARDFSITVDGRTTPIGRKYLAGPVTGTLYDAPAGEKPGTRILTVGAFLRPLSIGRHTVRIQGVLDGALLGGFTLSEDYTYTVEVKR